jgi:hypothetical protein
VGTEVTDLAVIFTDWKCIGKCKSNYYMIAAMIAPIIIGKINLTNL